MSKGTEVATRGHGDAAVQRIEERIDKSITGGMVVNDRGISFQNATEVMEYAKMMATSMQAVPPHLRANPGACLAIIDDAIRFGMSPYALARKSYFVNDRVAYEAQVIAAIVIRYAPLKKRPSVTYLGEEGKGNRQCVVVGEFNDGVTQEYSTPKISEIKPKNSPLWTNDPDQQLAYYALRGFGRRHSPETLLGLYDREEIEGIVEGATAEVAAPPKPTGLAARLAGSKPAATGFHAEAVDRGLNGTTEVIEDAVVDEDEPASGTAAQEAIDDDAPLSAATGTSSPSSEETAEGGPGGETASSTGATSSTDQKPAPAGADLLGEAIPADSVAFDWKAQPETHRTYLWRLAGHIRTAAGAARKMGDIAAAAKRFIEQVDRPNGMSIETAEAFVKRTRHSSHELATGSADAESFDIIVEGILGEKPEGA